MFLQALQSGGGFLDNVEMGIELVDMGTVVNSSDGLSDSEEQTLLGGGKGHEAAPAVGRSQTQIAANPAIARTCLLEDHPYFHSTAHCFSYQDMCNGNSMGLASP